VGNKRYILGDNKIKIESVKSMDFLKGVKPAFAEHMFHFNRIVEAFAMSQYGGVDILEQPICKKCEKPGWNTVNPNFVSTGDEDADREVRNCFCEACGTTSYNTLTLRNYLLQELGVQIDKIEEMETRIHGGVTL